MNRGEALDLLRGMIDRVYEAGTFGERIDTYRKLNQIYDQVASRKASSVYYDLMVKEGEIIVSEVEVSLGG